jgi:S-adenosylmethionine:tRNA-ribosyltransferase-isomerase (queuine synthetase)
MKKNWIIPLIRIETKTIFSNKTGDVAAPSAGLHFTKGDVR